MIEELKWSKLTPEQLEECRGFGVNSITFDIDKLRLLNESEIKDIIDYIKSSADHEENKDE